MAHSISAKKRIRQNRKRRALNRWRLRRLRMAVKDFDDKVLHASVEDATTAYRLASKLYDRVAQKNVIHKNTAARRKSRMNKKLKARAQG